MYSHLCRLVLCGAVTAAIAPAHTLVSSTTSSYGELVPEKPKSSWWAQLLSLAPLQWLAGVRSLETPEPAGPQVDVAVLPAPVLPLPCSVEPLAEITDAEALEFEESAGSDDVVNIEGLTPAMSTALRRFTRMVTSVGGSVTLTSAYRPASYQQHLRQVWEKWMELRDNEELGCLGLKAEVQGEFIRHELLESQRPALLSDHTRGIAFDAAVTLPPRVGRHRRRWNVDVLARRAGIRRPVAENDPVHFRLVAGVRRGRA